MADLGGLLNQLRHGGGTRRANAAAALVRHPDSAVVAALCYALENDGCDYARASAAQSLGKLGDPAAFEPLQRALTSPHQVVRRSAAEALGELQDQRAIESLCELLGDRDARLASAATGGLSRLGAWGFEVEAAITAALAMNRDWNRDEDARDLQSALRVVLARVWDKNAKEHARVAEERWAREHERKALPIPAQPIADSTSIPIAAPARVSDPESLPIPQRNS